MIKSGARIHRGAFTANYLKISRLTAEDRRLTFEARGLLFDVLAKPLNWEVWISDLIERSPAGKNKIYRILNELIEFKYVWKFQQRESSGRYLAPIYWVYGEPQTNEPKELMLLRSKTTDAVKPYPRKRDPVKPYLVKPYPDKPDTAKPDTDNHTQTNKHCSKKTKRPTTYNLANSVEWPTSITEHEKESILRIAGAIDVGVFQEIYYELIDCDTPVKNPVGYFFELHRRYKQDKFVPTKLPLRKKLQTKKILAEKRYAQIKEDSESQRLIQLAEFSKSGTKK
jgi:hypothetical protein